MGAIPAFPSFSAGEIPTAAKLTSIKTAGDFWALTPRCYGYASTATTITTGGNAQVITLDAEVYDIVQSGDSPSHDLVTNNSRVYVRTSGKYEIAAQVYFAANATGVRTGSVRLNAAGSGTGGTALVQTSQSALSTGGTALVFPVVEAALVAGDYLELFGFQNSGGNLATSTGIGVTFLRIKLTGS
jgi:hypothetical protein